MIPLQVIVITFCGFVVQQLLSGDKTLRHGDGLRTAYQSNEAVGECT